MFGAVPRAETRVCYQGLRTLVFAGRAITAEEYAGVHLTPLLPTHTPLRAYEHPTHAVLCAYAHSAAPPTRLHTAVQACFVLCGTNRCGTTGY
eukprot:655516-Rhodomonas_salina.1